jgi:predicted small lipoprotein YifL
MRSIVALAAAIVIALSGCGRKGAPLPPIVEVPQTTNDLAVYQQEQQAILTWSYPQLTQAGHTLSDLARVEVWRLEVPPGQEAALTGPTAEETRRQLLLTRGAVVARLEGESLRQATRGAALVHGDPLPAQDAAASSMFWYAVRSRRRDGTPSALSNVANWRPRPVPSAVVGLAAEPGADGITLSWPAEAGTSYLVERRAQAAAAPWELIVPTGVAGAGFTDRTATQRQSWRYRVRAVADGARGPASAEIEVPYPDVYPPAPAEALLCLPEATLVRISWQPSPEPAVHYALFRRVGEGGWEQVLPFTTGTEHIDRDPPAGELTYAVKTYDDETNEAPPIFCTARVGS